MLGRKRKRVGVLFVCASNICRSPMAEAAFRAKAAEAGVLPKLDIASAGIRGDPAGARADPRARAAASRRGYRIPARKARQVQRGDFARYDWILAMDDATLRALAALRPPSFAGHLGLYLDLASPSRARDVPDPYYGPLAGFERVLDLLEAPGDALVRKLARAFEAAG
jgi:protein-tyrosine phosphatase